MSDPANPASPALPGEPGPATECRPIFDATGLTGAPFPFPCRVVDADGTVIGPCREADLEIGRCVVYVVVDGRWQVGDDFRVATRVVHGRPPLHLEALSGPVSG